MIVTTRQFLGDKRVTKPSGQKKHGTKRLGDKRKREREREGEHELERQHDD